MRIDAGTCLVDCGRSLKFLWLHLASLFIRLRLRHPRQSELSHEAIKEGLSFPSCSRSPGAFLQTRPDIRVENHKYCRSLHN